MEIVAHVRLLESEQDALHPASPRPPQREPSRAWLDFFGGSWASTGLIGLDGDAVGQRWTLDGEGRLWLLTETGLLRPEIRPPRYEPGRFTPQQWLHMRPGPQVDIVEHRPWPRPMPGARLVVPDRGGLWIEPLRNEFGQPLPTFYMPLRSSSD